jgi:hypothetical protein
VKRKLIAWILIISGFIPVIFKSILYLMARLDYSVTIESRKLYDFYSAYGTGIIITAFFAGIVMIVAGLTMLKKEKYSRMATVEDKDLNVGERLIHKQNGDSSIVSVTNQRVRYYGFYTKELSNSVKNLPDSDREDYMISDILSVKAINSSDLMKVWFGLDSKWGIQLKMKNGKIINIPASGQDILAGHIDVVIRQN